MNGVHTGLTDFYVNEKAEKSEECVVLHEKGEDVAAQIIAGEPFFRRNRTIIYHCTETTDKSERLTEENLFDFVLRLCLCVTLLPHLQIDPICLKLP